MIVGLTGGIGCGKSTVSEIFKALNWTVFDADGFCRGVYSDAGSGVVDAFRNHWGAAVIDDNGGVNKSVVADIVFKDRVELKWLNAWFHPLVFNAMRQEVESCEDGMLLCDVPLLYEAGWENDFDVVISVWADRDVQYKRLALRGWNPEEIECRIDNQLSSDEKLKRADLGIINKYSEKILYKQCLETDRKLRT